MWIDTVPKYSRTNHSRTNRLWDPRTLRDATPSSLQNQIINAKRKYKSTSVNEWVQTALGQKRRDEKLTVIQDQHWSMSAWENETSKSNIRFIVWQIRDCLRNRIRSADKYNGTHTKDNKPLFIIGITTPTRTIFDQATPIPVITVIAMRKQCEINWAMTLLTMTTIERICPAQTWTQQSLYKKKTY